MTLSEAHGKKAKEGGSKQALRLPWALLDLTHSCCRSLPCVPKVLLEWSRSIGILPA